MTQKRLRQIVAFRSAKVASWRGLRGAKGDFVLPAFLWRPHRGMSSEIVRFAPAGTTITFAPALDGQTITLTPDTAAAGSVQWTCASGGVIQNKHLPAACRT